MHIHTQKYTSKHTYKQSNIKHAQKHKDTVPLIYNFIFTRVFLYGATTRVRVDHVPHIVEYTRLVCATPVTRMDIPRV